ncbi:hypothetical protein FACS1894139_15750 [Planctomycetales bacterium]|nr:hypothetical protein FACS1894107_04640 [Planctomycetales bacterium]GHS98895.1 hypothetical protein FACS1894108_07870 [Planctomycetales bacterium]GHT07431.1 hypothetical protein FACS1894139_15750 [Planctomycetales bacterium]
MRRHLILCVFILVGSVLTACGNPLAGDSSGFLPEDGEFAGLSAVGKRQVLFTDGPKEKYLGAERARFFKQYGLSTIYSRDYALGGEALTIEAYQIGSDLGAAGIFYYYVGQQLRNTGEEIDVGAQAVSDTAHGGRNLYFYKGRWLFALIYTGKEPVPDLKPLAQFLTARVPGQSRKPAGFAYIDVEGVAGKYARVTPGNALNFDIFPPGVWALAPGGGADARIFVIDFSEAKAAEKAGDDFWRYLQVNASDSAREKRQFGKTAVVFARAVDPREKNVVYAAFDRFVIVASHLDNFAAGETLVTRVIDKIRESRRGN